MNLIETIDKCIELVKEEIEGYEYYISEFENKSAYSAAIKEWKEGVEIWKEHLNNLEFMKHETGLQEIDEMIEPTWYILYDGLSVDGRGNPDFYKRTTDKQEAIEHWKKCKENPYSIGKVVAYTDTKQKSVYFDYDWEAL